MAKSLPKVEQDVEVSTNQAPLIRADRALESSRDAGFDLNAASGEPTDNSIEAGARRIYIEAFKVGKGGGSRHRESISEIAFADDGTGIPYTILANTLTVGFSTRYGSRKGLGRFGMGLKLAALSQGRRLEIYTKPAGSQQIFYAYFDLDEISSGMQKFICAEPTEAFPEKYVHLMRDDDGNDFSSGTLVVWSKVDRLEHAGHYGIAVDERLRDLTKYLARTYRKFLINGLIIKLQGRQINPHDPLFLLETPLAVELLSLEEWRAEILDFKPIEINGHKVEMTVTLLPEKVRLVKGEGGNRGSADIYKPLHIADNEGCVSIMRNGREIYYNIIPKLLPDGVSDLDRFIGIEAAFPAELDEYFQVRNVKRGAEPVDKLREEIRKFVRPLVTKARKKVRERWAKTEVKEQQDQPAHIPAVEAYKKMEETAPRGIAGADLAPEVADRIVEEAAQDLAETLPEDRAKDPEQLQEIKRQIQNQTITVLDGDWPGKELFEIDHLDGKVIMRLNWRHPFMREIYSPVREIAEGKGLDDLSPTLLQALGKQIMAGLDVLLFTYAKAENQHPQAEKQYGLLRSYWGQFAAESILNLVK